MTPEDMRALWASHCKYEFGLRDVEGALSTMVDDPYLWNVPTMCGRRVEIPQLAVAVRDGKIAHEHIWWDQASVTRLRDLPPS
jgi:hypothetical protein